MLAEDASSRRKRVQASSARHVTEADTEGKTLYVATMGG